MTFPSSNTPADRLAAKSQVSDKAVEVILSVLEEDKAEDIVVIDLTNKALFADCLIIATGLADRQIAAISGHIDRRLGEVGLKQIFIEGAGSEWVLVDAGDIIVHLFKPEARARYALERMWGGALDTSDPENYEMVAGS